MTRDNDAMDIDPPVPPTPGSPPILPTPSESIPSTPMPPSTPPPAPPPFEASGSSSKPNGDAKTTDDKDKEKGKSKDAPAPQMTPEEEAAAEAAAIAELLKGVPEPDVKAVLNKERAPGTHIDATTLSVPQLLALVDKALLLKAEGNKAFTSKPPNFNLARDDYIRALDCLPTVPKHLPPPGPGEDRIREITDDEAEQIELDFLAGPARIRADNAIRDAQKALWGNLGAVYSKQPGKDKETVEACTRALAFDPTYEKALLRRAAANERIGTWSSLVAAQNDCVVLTTLMPPDADALIPVRKALEVLPKKIAAAKAKETEDVVGKLGSL